MGRCCFCHSAKSKESGRTFHKFPWTDLFLLNQWIQNIPLKEWKPNKDSILCSDHFTEDCFDKSAFRVRLKLNSIPTRFEDPQGVCLFCNRKRTYKSDYAFFKFPSDKPELLNKWIQNMKMPNLHLTGHSLLCSSHFEQSCFKIKGKYLTLKENSIPTLFNVTNDTQNLKRKILSNKNNIAISDKNLNLKTAEHNVVFTQPSNHDEIVEDLEHCTEKPQISNTSDTQNLKRKIQNNKENISISDKNLNLIRTAELNEIFTQPSIHDEIVEDIEHCTEKSQTSNTSENSVTKSNSDSTPTTPVRKHRRIMHDHQYEKSPSTLRRKLYEAKETIKKSRETIKLQKRKMQRLQNDYYLLKR